MAEKKQRLSKKLAAYSAAAAAALAVAPAADAAIVYSGVQNITVNAGNPSYILDLNNDAGDDFQFAVDLGDGSVYIYSLTSALGFIGETAVNFDAARLPYGYQIDNSVSAPLSWYSGTEPLNGSSYTTQGSFTNATGYIGVRFYDVSGCTLFGWVQYSGTFGPSGTIHDWAYEDVCNTPILAGAGGTGPAMLSTVPTMGEWGMFLLAGLLSAAGIKAINREEETA